MTKVGLLTAALFIFVLSTLIAVTSETAQQDAASVEPPPVTKSQADRWMTELSNWGRWGKDDQLGALNLITPQKRKQAMALARTGTVVSLERPVALTPKPEESKADNKPHGISFYEIRFKTFPPGDPRGNDGFSSDIQEFHVHGGMTHLDALCHDSSDGRLYNGFPLTTVDENTGCTKLALDNVKEGLVTRGILIDMTRLKRRSPRQPGSRIYADDIEAWERQTGLRVSAGDALFAYNPQPGAPATGANGGFDLSVVPWLKARDVAVTSGVRPIPEDRHADHRLVLVALGVYLLDGVELRPLAETAARRNRWEFMLVVAPLRVPGSTGSPVNPLAMF